MTLLPQNSAGRLVVLATVSVAALVQCSVFNSLDSLGVGKADGGESSPQREAGTGTGDAASIANERQPTTADSGKFPDVAVADAAVDADGASNAGTPDLPPLFVDAGSTWCNQRNGASAFCADFDETPLPSGFGSSEDQFLALTSSGASSPPNTLHLLVPPTTVPSVFSSKVTRDFAAAAAKATLSFDFNPDMVNVTSSGVLFAALDFVGNASAKYSVRLAYNQGSVRVEESYLGYPSDVFHPSFTIPNNAWSHMRLEIAFPEDGGTTGTVAVFKNDALVGTRETLSPPGAIDRRPTLLIGAVYGTGPHTGWSFRYDNITLDIE